MFMGSTQKNSSPGQGGIADPMSVRPFRIQRVVKETHDTFSLELRGESEDGFNFAPGQFNMLYVFGVGEVPISISGDPEEKEALVHTTRAVGSVTGAMRKLKAGGFLGVRGPFGSSWPVEDIRGDDIVIIAGGIGLAPLRPVIYSVLRRREQYGKVVLLYGARTPEDIIFRKPLMKWRSRLDMDVHITVDRASGGWKGNVGVVTGLIGRAPFDPLSCTAMICGPEIMMRFTIRELKKRGVDDNKIFVSMERNMKCGIGLCGHCQIGPTFVCKDGPVYNYDNIKHLFAKREI